MIQAVNKSCRMGLGCLFVMVVISGSIVSASDWPQYRGINQDGVSKEKVDLKWGANGPTEVWKVPANLGFSSYAVSEGKVFTLVVRDVGGQPRELCIAMDADTGKEIWSADIAEGKGYSGGGGGDGPRPTPTVNDGMVYIVSEPLVVYCLDAKTGKEVWKSDLMKEHAGRNIGWRSAASAVLDGNLLFVGGGGAGQSLLALNKKTGDVAWKAYDETITHSTPVVVTIHGTRQVIFFLKSGLLSVSVVDGKELWRFPFPFQTSTAISPVVAGDIVYCSAGYGVGGGACRIKKDGSGYAAEKLWMIEGNKQTANHWSTPVCKDGYLYGMFSFKEFGKGPVKCVDINTGDVKWVQPGFGQGNIILVGDKLLALSDGGELVVIEADPKAYTEVVRTKAVNGKCWSTPAFSNGRIYVRSTEEGVCLDVNK